MNANPSATIDLPAQATLITVNNRLNAELQSQYDHQQAAAGLDFWPTPDIVPWSAWLQRGYQQLLDSGYTTRVLLNADQERLLWERVVRQSREGRQLLRPGAAARSAQQAWELIAGWRVTRQQLLDGAHDETLTYLGWQANFEELCEHQHLLSRAQLPDLLQAAAEDAALVVAARILLAGFDTLSPAQQALLDTLRQQAVEIDRWQADNGSTEASRVTLADSQHEMRAAAHWARKQIELDPTAQIAIVSPKLDQQRKALTRICASVISPHSLLPGQASKRAFNLSLGRPLADYPLVAHLTIALRLALHGTLPLDEVGTLLRSPFLGDHDTEWESRALLDAELRNDGLPQIDLSRLLARARQFRPPSAVHAPKLIARLQAFQGLLSQLPGEASPNAWTGHLLKLIECLGWPGDGPLDSSEYQQAAKLRETLSGFSTLARVQPGMRLPEVLRHLQQLCEDSVFQPQRDPAPIQILGALEAAGMRFDALWLLGMDDQTWPPAPAPNPLLPTRLQRELDMPHACAERELRFARQLTAQLLHCAPLTVVSHAAKDGDREQRPSPLTVQLPVCDIESLGITVDDELYLSALSGAPTEPLPAPDALPPHASPGGGSRLLSDQSACPFRAVARHRLGAAALAEASAAPSPALLGSILHQLLKQVWDRLQSAEQLRSLDDADLRALIEPLARATLNDLGRRRPDVFTPTFTGLETQRLCRLLLDWLNLEKQRPLPFQVLRSEQQQRTDLGGLSLQLQADRVDRLDDGRLVIIDYKSGERADAGNWLDPRPSELQVPLYCVQAEQAPAAALIARVHARNLAFKGQAQDDNIAPGLAAFQGDDAIPDWPHLLAHWRGALQHLAAEIQQGRADIEPQSADTCTWCDLGALCRIGSLLTPVTEGNESE